MWKMQHLFLCFLLNFLLLQMWLLWGLLLLKMLLLWSLLR
jgi:hypothetical protein